MNYAELLRFLSAQQEEEDHKHKCDYCGCVWIHSDACATDLDSEQEYQKAHDCPECGRDQRDKYFGNEAPTFRDKIVRGKAKRVAA